MFKTHYVDYKDESVELEGYYACEAQETTGKKPAIIVCHDWSGRNDFACSKADKLAELGYVGFALDMYGKGKRGNTNEEKTALIRPFIDDRYALQRRVLAAFETVKSLDHVDPNKIGVIGFCFGGLCALDLARSGADIKATVSFHGLLHAPTGAVATNIWSKVLVCHGYDDPMVSPDHINEFAREMTAANVDWQIHMYGGTMHAFTNPAANDKSFGTAYDRTADLRSWKAMQDFFNETLR